MENFLRLIAHVLVPTSAHNADSFANCECFDGAATFRRRKPEGFSESQKKIGNRMPA